MADSVQPGRIGLRHLFGHRAFRLLFIAETQSIIGDQLARLALSVLVFDRTNSTLASALTYAVSFLPAVFGGFVLGQLGDRYPRRRVMVATDVVRALLFLVMAVPALPLGVVVGLLAVAVFLGPAFSSAEVGYLAAALDREVFRAATAARSAANQVAQVVGFGIGGVVIAVLEPRGALLVNAATFAASALVITVGLRAAQVPVPAAEPLALTRVPASRPALAAETAESDPPFAGLWRDAGTRAFMGLTVLMGLFVVPESLAVSYGRTIGASTVETGLLIAMIPLGSAVGAAAVVRIPAGARQRVAGWMAVACGLPLLVNAANPAWQVACVFWFASGVLAAYQIEAITVLVHAIPEAVRSRLLGVLGAWLLGAQGVGFALGGLLSGISGPGPAMAMTAGFGVLLALTLVLGPLRDTGATSA